MRMYLDRMVGRDVTASELVCGNCGRLLGVKITFEKEQRLAYRLFAGSVTKKVVPVRSVPTSKE